MKRLWFAAAGRAVATTVMAGREVAIITDTNFPRKVGFNRLSSGSGTGECP
jgi:hypothetical protein